MRKWTPFALLAVLLLGAGCARPTAPNAPSADVLTGDTKAIQGAWAVVSVEDGRIENLTGEAKKEAEALMKEVRLVFDGNRMIIIERGEDEPVPFSLDESKNPKVMALSLGGSGGAAPRAGTSYGGTRPATARPGTSFSTAPRTGTSFSTFRTTGRTGTAPGTAAPEGQTWRWIYKLDGDTLTVAFIKKNKTLVPTEFKARADASEPGQPAVPGVTVITLKRTNEPLPNRPRAGTQVGGTRPDTRPSVGRVPPVTAK